MKAWNFDRYANGELMAEGIRVHAESLESALTSAYRLLDATRQHNKCKEELVFIDNEPCVSKCLICEKQAQDEKKMFQWGK